MNVLLPNGGNKGAVPTLYYEVHTITNEQASEGL